MRARISTVIDGKSILAKMVGLLYGDILYAGGFAAQNSDAGKKEIFFLKKSSPTFLKASSL